MARPTTPTLPIQVEKGYLTALWEVHHTTGMNQQHIRFGDVVQIHDDFPKSQMEYLKILY